MMLRKILLRAGCSFCVTGMVNVIVMLVIGLCMGWNDFVPMVPEYQSLFPSESVALCCEMILIAVIGAAFGACSVIMEVEKWGFLKQGILHLILTTIVWLPITIFVWSLYRYPQAIVSSAISYAVTYGITWGMRALRYKKMVKDINDMLN